MFNANASLTVSRSRVKSLLTMPLVILSTGLERKTKGRHDRYALHTPSAVNIFKEHMWFPTVRIRYDWWTDNINSTMTGQGLKTRVRVPDRARQFPSLPRLYRSATRVLFWYRERRPKCEANHSFPSDTDSMCNNGYNFNSAECNRWFLLHILLLAQQVSGTIMPIIRSSRVLHKWLMPVVFGAWFSSCRYGVELRVVCPVCGLLASNKICNKNHLLHLVGILFPHINDDARSKPH